MNFEYSAGINDFIGTQGLQFPFFKRNFLFSAKNCSELLSFVPNNPNFKKTFLSKISLSSKDS